MFTFGNSSVSEADENCFVSLDVNTAVYVFDILQLKRLRRPVIVAFDVYSFAVAFPFDVVTGFDAFECDVLHCLPSVLSVDELFGFSQCIKRCNEVVVAVVYTVLSDYVTVEAIGTDLKRQ